MFKSVGVVVAGLAFALIAKMPTSFFTRGFSVAGQGIQVCGTKVTEVGDKIADAEQAERTAQASAQAIAVADAMKTQSEAVVAAIDRATSVGGTIANERAAQDNAVAAALKGHADATAAAVDRATAAFGARQANLEEQLSREMAATISLNEQLAQLGSRVERLVAQAGNPRVVVVPVRPYPYPPPPPYSYRR